MAHALVHRHREPWADGYGEVVVHGADAILHACGVEVAVGELLAGLD